jgi:hypothetical protein
MNHQTLARFIPLSPIDCVFVGPGSYPIEFAFFYGRSLQKSLHGSLLDEAWQTLTDRCPILKARLTQRGDQFGLSWEDDQPPQPISWQKVEGDVHPEHHVTPYDLVEPVTTAIGQNLASLKISEGRDGTTLGFSLSHAVADGFTYFMMLQSLAAIMRQISNQEAPSAMLPLAISHDRSLISSLADLISDPAETSQAAPRLPGFSVAPERADIPRRSIRSVQRYFPKDQLQAMYQEFVDAPKRLSTNDMLCAALWREFARDFDPQAASSVSLVAPVDFRRLDRSFPRYYAGNAVVLARVDLEREQLLRGSLMDIALKVRAAVGAVDQLYIKDTIRHLASRMRPDAYAGLGQIHIVDPHAGLLITNLSRMSFASLDLGSGAPTYCRPLTPCKRAIVLLSDGADGIVAHIQ